MHPTRAKMLAYGGLVSLNGLEKGTQLGGDEDSEGNGVNERPLVADGETETEADRDDIEGAGDGEREGEVEGDGDRDALAGEAVHMMKTPGR